MFFFLRFGVEVRKERKLFNKQKTKKLTSSLPLSLPPSLSLPSSPPSIKGDEATARRLELRQPILTRDELEAFVAMSNDATTGPLHPSMRGWTSALLDATWPAADGAAGLQPALARLCQAASAAADDGAAFVVLSDREAGAERVAIPPLAALGAVHHHLVGLQKRSRVGLIVEASEPREVHHFCCLLGYGADAVCPSLALEALRALRADGRTLPKDSDEEVASKYVKAINAGVLKVSMEREREREREREIEREREREGGGREKGKGNE